ncbi:MAG: 3-oxoacyl-ACP synthase [Chitinophagaceae bacterium]|nr:MAG: 3-oxoacyl-ACP synthase [Chitinophagaceae bacterium]
MTFKETVYEALQNLVAQKIDAVQQTLQDLHASAANETKSTAGDKHETALAMLQLEQENKRKQLKDLQEQAALLQKINPAVASQTVLNGALVQTAQGYFFISIGIGKMMLAGKTVYALSPQAPLGQLLRGKVAGERVTLNGKSYKLLSVE